MAKGDGLPAEGADIGSVVAYLWWQACRLSNRLSCSRHGCLYRKPTELDRIEESPRRPFHLVFLFVHKKRIALTFSPSLMTRT